MLPWRLDARVLVIGDVFVDYPIQERILRLGGIFHPARALHAFGVRYALGYIAPSYLEEAICQFSTDLGSERTVRLGLVDGSPAVMLVRDAQESGDQGYDEILREARRVSWDPRALDDVLTTFSPTDVLILPGSYPVNDVARCAVSHGARLHCDTQYAADVSAIASAAGVPLDTVFVSTSSSLFRVDAGGQPDALRVALGPLVARTLILKENRGGSRVVDLETEGMSAAPSFPTRTAHSIGVGDCFDCAWIAAPDDETITARLTRASYLASLYASTWKHSHFVTEVQGALAMDAAVVELAGVRLPWETRPQYHVYIAAPDFPDVDTAPLDELAEALRFHNFRPHRPVQECGVYHSGMSAEEARGLYAHDRALLASASLVIAVPLTPDPGTYTELGLACGTGLPTILWNRGGTVRNLFAAYTATRVCRTLDEVIDATFELLGKNLPPRESLQLTLETQE